MSKRKLVVKNGTTSGVLAVLNSSDTGADDQLEQQICIPFIPSPFLISKINTYGIHLKQKLINDRDLQKSLREAACALALEKPTICDYTDRSNLKRQFLAVNFDFKEGDMIMTDFIAALAGEPYNLTSPKLKLEKYMNKLIDMHAIIIEDKTIMAFLRQNKNSSTSAGRVEELLDETSDCDEIKRIVDLCQVSTLKGRKKAKNDDAEAVSLVVQAPLGAIPLDVRRNDPTSAEIKTMVTFCKQHFISVDTRIFVNSLIQGTIFFVDLTIPTTGGCIIPGDVSDLQYLDQLRQKISLNIRSQDHILHVSRQNQDKSCFQFLEFGSYKLNPFGSNVVSYYQTRISKNSLISFEGTTSKNDSGNKKRSVPAESKANASKKKKEEQTKKEENEESESEMPQAMTSNSNTAHSNNIEVADVEDNINEAEDNNSEEEENIFEYNIKTRGKVRVPEFLRELERFEDFNRQVQAKVTLMDQVTKFNEKNTGHNLLSEGTIYGEVTAGSLSKILTHPAVQQVLDDPNVANIFLDVGSGLGCPTLQMALLYPKLESLGIEVIQNRYAGALTNYFSLIQKEILSDEKISFGCCNALDLTSFNPCTIVYFFHVGLQDILWIEFLKVLNKSTTVRIFICYEPPEKLLRYEPGLRYGEFGATIGQLRMKQSTEGRTAYLYIIKQPKTTLLDQIPSPIDPIIASMQLRANDISANLEFMKSELNQIRGPSGIENNTRSSKVKNRTPLKPTNDDNNITRSITRSTAKLNPLTGPAGSDTPKANADNNITRSRSAAKPTVEDLTADTPTTKKGDKSKIDMPDKLNISRYLATADIININQNRNICLEWENNNCFMLLEVRYFQLLYYFCLDKGDPYLTQFGDGFPFLCDLFLRYDHSVDNISHNEMREQMTVIFIDNRALQRGEYDSFNVALHNFINHRLHEDKNNTSWHSLLIFKYLHIMECSSCKTIRTVKASQTTLDIFSYKASSTTLQQMVDDFIERSKGSSNKEHQCHSDKCNGKKQKMLNHEIQPDGQLPTFISVSLPNPTHNERNGKPDNIPGNSIIGPLLSISGITYKVVLVGYFFGGHYRSLELDPNNNVAFVEYDGMKSNPRRHRKYLQPPRDGLYQPTFMDSYLKGDGNWIAEFVNLVQVDVQELKAGDHVSIYNCKRADRFCIDQILSITVTANNSIEIVFQYMHDSIVPCSEQDNHIKLYKFSDDLVTRNSEKISNALKYHPLNFYSPILSSLVTKLELVVIDYFEGSVVGNRPNGSLSDFNLFEYFIDGWCLGISEEELKVKFQQMLIVMGFTDAETKDIYIKEDSSQLLEPTVSDDGRVQQTKTAFFITQNIKSRDSRSSVLEYKYFKYSDEEIPEDYVISNMFDNKILKYSEQPKGGLNITESNSVIVRDIICGQKFEGDIYCCDETVCFLLL